MIKILATITALFAASAAYAADSHRLATHGLWEVDVNVGDNDFMWCDTASQQNDSRFAITLDDEGDYHLITIIDAAYIDKPSIDLVMTLDNNRWTLKDAKVTSLELGVLINFSFTESGQRRFLRDFSRSNFLTIRYDNGRIAARWSLRGSRDAIRALNACGQKIMVSY